MTEEYDDETLADLISEDRELIAGLLSLDEEYPLESGSAGQVVLRALRSAHWNLAPEGGPSEITATLRSFINPAMSPALISAAATALGYVEPVEFLRCVCTTLCLNPDQRMLWNHEGDEIDKRLLSNGIATAGNALREYYFGNMCPGYMNVLEDNPEEQAAEWERMSQLFTPIIRIFGAQECSSLLVVLSALSDHKRAEEPEE
jgi:hypothetical protein